MTARFRASPDQGVFGVQDASVLRPKFKPSPREALLSVDEKPMTDTAEADKAMTGGKSAALPPVDADPIHDETGRDHATRYGLNRVR